MNAFEKIQKSILGYQSACILAAAGELDLFTQILKAGNSVTAETLASQNGWNLRALKTLLNALVPSGFLNVCWFYNEIPFSQRLQEPWCAAPTADGKTEIQNSVRIKEEKFSVPEEFLTLLDSRTPETVIPMIQHRSTCLRNWSQLAWTVQSGVPAPRTSSVNGPLADYRSFVWAMNSIAGRVVKPVTESLKAAGLLNFRRMLDVGGATGTYLKAFLEVNPEGKGTIFDLPIAIQEASQSFAGTQWNERIALAEGDFYCDEFPAGCDFHWMSAIIHQHDAPATRMLFEKSFRALDPGGSLAIRDVFYNSDRTGPIPAINFAVNMLSATRSGMVYTREEVFDLFTQAGFQNPRIVRDADDMTSVLAAEKPQ